MRIEDLRAEITDPGEHVVAEERGGIIEALHTVHAAVVDNTGRLVAYSGDPSFYTFSRSCLKPVQVLPILLNKVHEAYGLTRKEIAIISGSHSGEPEHVEAVRSILSKAGLDETLLQCGGHEPFHKETNFSIGGKFTSIHDNCSGKHAGSLALTKHMGWDLRSYLDPSHPAQKAVLDVACALGDMDSSAVGVAPDGCSIPNLAYPIWNLATQFARIADPVMMQEECRFISDSMMENPFMVAGTGRFDKDLMEDHPGYLVAKAGAVGLQAMAVRTEGKWLGVAIKVLDGSHPALTTATYKILDELGAGTGQGIGMKYRDQAVNTRAGIRIGSIECIGSLEFA